MNLPKYPDDFYDFSDGINIGDSQINRWIKEAIEDLENNSYDYASRASGNMHVHVRRIDEPDTEYEITVSSRYSQTMI